MRKNWNGLYVRPGRNHLVVSPTQALEIIKLHAQAEGFINQIDMSKTFGPRAALLNGPYRDRMEAKA